MNNTNDHKALDHNILAEQIIMLYRSMVASLVVHLMFSSILTYALWEVVPQTTLIIWMSLMISIQLARGVLFFIYRQRFKPEQAKSYGLFFSIGSAIVGIIWGVGGAVMLPLDNLEYQLFIAFLLSLLALAANSTLYIYLPAFFSFFLITGLPAAIKLIYIGGSTQLALGAILIAGTISVPFFTINNYRAMRESIRLRFENIDLVEQLNEQKNEAVNTNLAKSKFLAAASHDLRQPLYALSLFTSVLEEIVKEPEALRVVSQIKTSGESMKSMFNALLNISQLDAGVMHPKKINFLLQPLFETLANDFDPLTKQKNLLIHWPTCAFAVHSDQELVEQILRNFISNAIRYTDKGSITIRCVAENEQIIISVSDTGIGISEENKKAIFDEYNQIGNSERDRTKGLGLGLAIVQRTADLLQHDITVESQLNQGSTFSISIEQANIEGCVVKQKPVQLDKLKKSSDILIVVIDDDVSVLEGTQILFESWGCTVIAATDQQQALTLIKQRNQIPDGIIADYRLRNNETGVAVIQSIHGVFNDSIPALIVTGDIEVDRLKDVDRSGIQMLPKPVSPLKLRTFLRNVEKLKSANA